MNATEINEAVDLYLSKAFILAKVTKLGDSCPPVCQDKGQRGVGEFPRHNHIHGQHHQIILTRKNEAVVFDFWNSYHDAELNAGIEKRGKQYYNAPRMKRPGLPKIASILACLQWNDSGSFEGFCSEYGYEEDSRKAYHTYELIQEEYQKTAKFFTAAERNELAELVREY